MSNSNWGRPNRRKLLLAAMAALGAASRGWAASTRSLSDVTSHTSRRAMFLVVDRAIGWEGLENQLAAISAADWHVDHLWIVDNSKAIDDYSLVAELNQAIASAEASGEGVASTALFVWTTATNHLARLPFAIMAERYFVRFTPWPEEDPESQGELIDYMPVPIETLVSAFDRSGRLYFVQLDPGRPGRPLDPSMISDQDNGLQDSRPSFHYRSIASRGKSDGRNCR